MFVMEKTYLFVEILSLLGVLLASRRKPEEDIEEILKTATVKGKETEYTTMENINMKDTVTEDDKEDEKDESVHEEVKSEEKKKRKTRKDDKYNEPELNKTKKTNHLL